ncbi:uncharacterized protein LACBIDRAFT_324610 [Laccaria bicolor S238N-H82]|uniref:Predicted protein n=1 Tax=Laccaria bicolor (strain S238N-H82 / ATCC MYA-4686) TaxID=486041 RepID=B0D2G4_LACBS|nr:uncharacterized protein LACBIDRAFT_324610 [Laccaria bicolor S238N-H82]EDR11095.1 predicted protein [Laccaria bicolor S238N-H82]|eukprot:XP_001878396.1 predicted protein [Laccaria bicolor S238N-H82]
MATTTVTTYHYDARAIATDNAPTAVTMTTTIMDDDRPARYDDATTTATDDSDMDHNEHTTTMVDRDAKMTAIGTTTTNTTGTTTTTITTSVWPSQSRIGLDCVKHEVEGHGSKRVYASLVYGPLSSEKGLSHPTISV